MTPVIDAKIVPMAAVLPNEIDRPIPGERSSVPAFALLLGWFIPGAGHLLVGKWGRALLLFGAIVSMYALGLGLGGKVYLPNTNEVLEMLGFVGQLGMGLLYVLARGAGWGNAAAQTVYNDYGTKYLVACGLLNVVAAIDAYSLANGRKAS